MMVPLNPAMMWWLFRRIHYAFNEQSGRVIEKCGFRREGIMRAAEPLVDGCMEDMVFYSVVADEAVLE